MISPVAIPFTISAIVMFLSNRRSFACLVTAICSGVFMVFSFAISITFFVVRISIIHNYSSLNIITCLSYFSYSIDKIFQRIYTVIVHSRVNHYADWHGGCTFYLERHLAHRQRRFKMARCVADRRYCEQYLYTVNIHGIRVLSILI